MGFTVNKKKHKHSFIIFYAPITKFMYWNESSPFIRLFGGFSGNNVVEDKGCE